MMKTKKIPTPSLYSRCKCGWTGTIKQLSILLRKDKVVSKICPECGIPSSAHKALPYQAINQSKFTH